MNEGHAEFRADEGEVARAIRGPIVDVDALGDPAPADGALQDR